MSHEVIWKRYKKNLKFSNDKLEQYEVLQKQPQDVVTIHQEIEFLRKTLSKLIGSIGKLNKVLRCKKCSTGKFGNGYKGKKYDHDEDTISKLLNLDPSSNRINPNFVLRSLLLD
ncbi:hypothetical protein JHK87_022494 [Glycine soja]|nr:hypothetical protein JHK87_022494 [Glycine soja]